MARLSVIENLALGSDSPLTATGDLLDELRFAMRLCRISPDTAYRMVTDIPAAVLRLQGAEGTLAVSARADLIGVRDTGADPAHRLQTLALSGVEFVMIAGRVQLASEGIWRQLRPAAKRGLQPLAIDGTVRWLRAPVQELLRAAEEVLGEGEVRLGGKPCRVPTAGEFDNPGSG